MITLNPHEIITIRVSYHTFTRLAYEAQHQLLTSIDHHEACSCSIDSPHDDPRNLKFSDINVFPTTSIRFVSDNPHYDSHPDMNNDCYLVLDLLRLQFYSKNNSYSRKQYLRLMLVPSSKRLNPYTNYPAK